MVTCPGMINVDFADVKSVMSARGVAMMGTDTASGPDRASVATEAALQSPLLEDVDLSGAAGILVNVAASEDLSLGEFNEVGEIVGKFASQETTVVVGTVIDSALQDSLRVTVVVTGLGAIETQTDPSAATPIEPSREALLNAQHSRVSETLHSERYYRNIMQLDTLDIPALLRR